MSKYSIQIDDPTLARELSAYQRRVRARTIHAALARLVRVGLHRSTNLHDYATSKGGRATRTAWMKKGAKMRARRRAAR